MASPEQPPEQPPEHESTGEPPAKKAKVDEAEASEREEALAELEVDEVDAPGPRLKDPVAFNVEDTSVNVMQSTLGKLLSPIHEGGMQYLLAGARASVGLKSGRYAFEARVVDAALMPAERSLNLAQRYQLRLGFSTAGSWLCLGESADSFCFDLEGNFIHDGVSVQVSAELPREAWICVLLNLDTRSPNANTVSLFVDGKRAAPPQPIPEGLRGKALHPTVGFKKLTVEYNFGPAMMVPLPFRCKMVGEALVKDTQRLTYKRPSDGIYDVIFPVGLPGEGTYDWLDEYLESRPEVVEISERCMLRWAEGSGLRRKPRGVKDSLDKPDMSFGIDVVDDRSIMRVLQAVAPLQQRHFAVMEVKANLLSEQRQERVAKWNGRHFRTTAMVMMGEPPVTFLRRGKELMLREKQAALDLKFEAEKKAQETLAAQQQAEGADTEAVPKQALTPPPKAELTEEERALEFREKAVPDMTELALKEVYGKFTAPSQEEGFDEVKYEWCKDASGCEAYVTTWKRQRKLRTRVEDIQPSEWFRLKTAAWQKQLQAWQAVNKKYKAAMAAKSQPNAVLQAAEEEAAGGGSSAGAEKVQVDFDTLDIFGVEDVTDVAYSGEPLFSRFGFEDWSVMTLRFELCTLVQAFQRDVKDPDRPGMAVEHVPFYYSKYFKKGPNLKFYGVEKVEQLLALVRDTIAVDRTLQVVMTHMPEEVENFSIFVMLTEEARRDRQRRLCLGDESAKLNITAPSPAIAAAIMTGANIGAAVTAAAPASKSAGGAPCAGPAAGTTAASAAAQVVRKPEPAKAAPKAGPLTVGPKAPGVAGPVQAKAKVRPAHHIQGGGGWGHGGGCGWGGGGWGAGWW